MATPMAKNLYQNVLLGFRPGSIRGTKMCLQCLLRIGVHSRSIATRSVRPSSLLQQTFLLQQPSLLRQTSSGLPPRKIGGAELMIEQQRHMSVLLLLAESFEKSAKLKGKERGPKFTMEYGVEGAVARELISFGAKVHFTNGKWYGRKKLKNWRFTQPGQEASDFTVNAIDGEDSFLNQGAIEKMSTELDNVKYLNLDGCKYVDDHCLASLVHMRDSLTHLSINRCNQITDGGLASLHKLRKLEKLNINNLPLVKSAKLVAILLEDRIPGLRISIVTEQVEEYKEKIKLLKGSEQEQEEIELKKTKPLDGDDGERQSRTVLKEDSVAAAEDEQSKKEKDAWRDSLIQEKA